ncbi:MAG: capsule biosynthesis protein [Pseudomonadota bacterium]
MTTKPRARKFRIRRTDRPAATSAAPAASTATAAAQNVDAAENDLYVPAEDGFGDLAMPGSAAAERAQKAQDGAAGSTPAPPPTVEEELTAIRAEGLTGRQLRMARRVAQKHGLQPSSDFDAVRLLRHRGIDPFGQSNMLELVTSQKTAGARDAKGKAGQTALPARAETAQVPAVAPQPGVPAQAQPQGPLDADARAAEIMRVQRDIAKRRRKRLVLLASRLCFFVMLPTLLVGYYYFGVATPLYATNTELVIQKAESGPSAGGGGGLGGLLGGGGFATVTESITVQSYLESREAMLRLDEELDFRGHFSDPSIDPLTRLPEDATVEDMYATYLRYLTIGYDPTEGLIKIEVAATDPQTSQAFSEALIRYAEERVDQMSQRLRLDQMAGASDSFEDAASAVSQAQQRVLELQERRGVLSAEAEVSSVFSQISAFEMELQQERLRLDEMLAVARPQPTRVEVAERNISRLESLIAELRGGLTEAQDGDASLARIQSELIVAQADLETRQLMLANAMQQVESARVEANRQTLYLSLGVFPVAPDAPAYPRALENTILAFLIFSGIYLMLSMTASILREQVSS